ncbi:hypothetical protein ACTOJ1_001529 [Shigella flexneri]
MAEINKNKNSGYLFVNKKKTGKQPDYRGKITIEGKEYWLSGWESEKDGEKMWSLSATDPSTVNLAPHNQNSNNQQRDNKEQSSNKSDPQPEDNKKDSSDGFPDPDFFSDIFSTPQ